MRTVDRALWMHQALWDTLETHSLRIRVRAFAVFGDEAVDPRRDNGQRYRAELEHGIVESANVEFSSERFLRFFAGTHDHEERGRPNMQVTRDDFTCGQ
jgi:hypothetical protein